MHVHVARVRKNGKTYEYCQLVESYRRDDGMPTQRVVANLGRLAPHEVHNVKTAIAASRQGERVVIAANVQPGARKPAQNLRYLDLAVLLELWKEAGLYDVVDQVMPPGDAEVRPADVVTALTLQRCVDPGSKLYAERWFPRTALPELLRIDPKSFNNTRVHRVLEQLDRASAALMRRLPELYRSRKRTPFAALFLDVTDARFVGGGPGLATRGKTKEGIVAWKIGIVLLCDEEGFPLRWEVVEGKTADPPAMRAVIDDVRHLPWVKEVPLVIDRVMGTSADIEKLLRTGVHFLTALKSTEFDSYAENIPHGGLTRLQPSSMEDEACLAEAAEIVAKAGMRALNPTLYVKDGGVVERGVAHASADAPTSVAQMMEVARRAQGLVDEGSFKSFRAAMRKLGFSTSTATSYQKLIRLDPEIQCAVLDGKADALSLRRLRDIAPLSPDEQRRRFDLALQGAKPRRPPQQPSKPDEPETKPVSVRVVVTFNPELFVYKRRRAMEQLEDVKTFVRTLNDKLAHRGGRTKDQVYAELDRFLRKASLLHVFKIDVTDRAPRLEVEAVLDEDRWQRLRRHDGFAVLVGHSGLTQQPAELARLYRAKDAVEKDFQVIKSVVKLRPMWHRTDAKVRAHVTLCMLALTLERTLRHRLKKNSAEAAIETLAPCNLNRFVDDGKSLYVVTQPDDEQHKLLQELGLERLANDVDVAAQLRLR